MPNLHTFNTQFVMQVSCASINVSISETVDEKPISSRKTRSTSKVVSSSDFKETRKLSSKKQNVPGATSGKSNVHTGGRSFIVPSFVPRESSGGKSFANPRRESIAPTRPGSGGSIKSTQMRKSSRSKSDTEDADLNFLDMLVQEVGARDNSGGKIFANSRRESITTAKPASGESIKARHVRKSSKSMFDIDELNTNCLYRPVLEAGARESEEDKNPTPESAEKFEKKPSPPISNPQSGKILPLPIPNRCMCLCNCYHVAIIFIISLHL